MLRSDDEPGPLLTFHSTKTATALAATLAFIRRRPLASAIFSSLVVALVVVVAVVINGPNRSTGIYINHFNTSDNAYRIKLPDSHLRERSFAFLIADFGLSTSAITGECCQTIVADMMKAKRAELEAAGKQLLFVGAGGDNFYWLGLNQETCPNNTCPAGKHAASPDGKTQWKRWNTTYTGLSDVPWLSVMGNHDLGNSDPFALCPQRKPRVVVDGQPYASNQLDEDKGGYRAGGPTRNFHMPDFNWRYTIDALNLEVYGLDQNYVDAGGIGGDDLGHASVLQDCGFGSGTAGDIAMQARLTEIGLAGEKLLVDSAALGAADPSKTRNVLVIQHYPGVCERLNASFHAAAPEDASMIDFRCAFGHTHLTKCGNTQCPWSITKRTHSCADLTPPESQVEQPPEGQTSPSAGPAGAEPEPTEDCAFPLIGGGGGCCLNGDDVGNPIDGAGYGLLTFDPNGRMHVELFVVPTRCELLPKDASQAERDAAAHYSKWARLRAAR